MRRFELFSKRDPSGGMGTGVVAIGVEFPFDERRNTWVALKWLGANLASHSGRALTIFSRLTVISARPRFIGSTRTSPTNPRSPAPKPPSATERTHVAEVDRR